MTGVKLRERGGHTRCPWCFEGLASAAVESCAACEVSVHAGCKEEFGGCPSCGEGLEVEDEEATLELELEEGRLPAEAQARLREAMRVRALLEGRDLPGWVMAGLMMIGAAVTFLTGSWTFAAVSVGSMLVLGGFLRWVRLRGEGSDLAAPVATRSFRAELDEALKAYREEATRIKRLETLRKRVLELSKGRKIPPPALESLRRRLSEESKALRFKKRAVERLLKGVRIPRRRVAGE